MEGIKAGLLQIQQQKCKSKRKPDSVSGKLKQKVRASGEVFSPQEAHLPFPCLSLTSWFQEGFVSRRAAGWGHKLLWLRKEVVLSIKCALGQLLQFLTLLTCGTSFLAQKLCIHHVTIIHVHSLPHFGVNFNIDKCTIPRLELPHGSHKEKPSRSSSLSSLLSLHQSEWFLHLWHLSIPLLPHVPAVPPGCAPFFLHCSISLWLLCQDGIPIPQHHSPSASSPATFYRSFNPAPSWLPQHPLSLLHWAWSVGLLIQDLPWHCPSLPFIFIYLWPL